MKDDRQLLEPGRNCWRIERATQATVIVDADDYFKAARAAMILAKKQILLVGWDFDARIRFGGDVDDGGPNRVGAFINWLVKRTPGLHVYVLLWDTGAIKTLSHGQTLIRVARWMTDSQIHLRLDGQGLSGISCAGGHNGKEGDPICPDAKSRRSRTSCWISCWLAVTPAPPWRRAACSTL